MGLGFLVGMLGTGLGGLSAIFLPRISPYRQGTLVGFSGGVMLGVVIWDLFPEAFRLGPTYGLGGLLAGVLFILILRAWINSKEEGDRDIFIRFTRTGVLLSIGIAVHNLPEGVAVGTVFAEDPASPLWRELALLMAIHNIPEGLAIATSLRLGKTRWLIVALALVVTEMPMVVGALLGGFLGYFSTIMSASALGFAAGAMTLLVMTELLPLARQVSDQKSALSGMAVGLLTAWLIIGFFE